MPKRRTSSQILLSLSLLGGVSSPAVAGDLDEFYDNYAALQASMCSPQPQHRSLAPGYFQNLVTPTTAEAYRRMGSVVLITPGCNVGMAVSVNHAGEVSIPETIQMTSRVPRSSARTLLTISAPESTAPSSAGIPQVRRHSAWRD